MSEPEEKREGDDEVPPPGKRFVSASQLKLFFACERKWSFTYMLGLKTPSGRGAKLGSLVHKQLEKYLEFGTPLDFTQQDAYGTYVAEVAAPMLQFLPEPKAPGLHVERYFKFEVPECPAVIFRGYIDYELNELIGDHKSCRTFDYALKADDLAGDIQAILYAKDYFLRHLDRDEVSLQWGYMRTESPFTPKPVRARLTRAQVDLVWPEIVQGANRLVATYLSTKQPLELPFNADECLKYSREGCPFQGTCNLTPKQRRPFRNTSNMTPTDNLLKKIEARKAELTGGPATMTDTPKLSLKARIEAARAAQAAAPAPVADTDVPAPTSVEQTAFVPKAPPPPPMPASDQPINCPTDSQPPPTSDAARIEAEAEALAAIVPVTEAAKAKGRPKGSKNAAAPEGIDAAKLNAFLDAATRYFESKLVP